MSIREKLEAIENVMTEYSPFWHFDVPQNLGNLLDILPNGSVRFHPGVKSKLNQLILVMGAAGTRGLTAQEASEMLGTLVTTISGFFGQDRYKGLFRKTEEQRYALSSSGMERLGRVIALEETEAPEAEEEE